MSKPTAAVLLYHRVAAVKSDPWRLAVDPARFAEHLEVVSSMFSPLSLAELVRAAAERRIPERAVAITFDDGYRDNLYAAKPLLERYGVPATVFVVTGYIDSGRDFWWDELGRFCEGDDEYRALHRTLMTLDADEREVRLEALRVGRAAVGHRAEPAASTTDELVRLVDGELIEVGAHTVTHPVLPELSRSRQLYEMRTSKRLLEDALGTAVESFSYPYGSYSAETVACAREAGFSRACTSARMPLTPAADPLEVPRLHVDDWSGKEFERRLSEWLT